MIREHWRVNVADSVVQYRLIYGAVQYRSEKIEQIEDWIIYMDLNY